MSSGKASAGTAQFHALCFMHSGWLMNTTFWKLVRWPAGLSSQPWNGYLSKPQRLFSRVLLLTRHHALRVTRQVHALRATRSTRQRLS